MHSAGNHSIVFLPHPRKQPPWAEIEQVASLSQRDTESLAILGFAIVMAQNVDAALCAAKQELKKGVPRAKT